MSGQIEAGVSPAELTVGGDALAITSRLPGQTEPMAASSDEIDYREAYAVYPPEQIAADVRAFRLMAADLRRRTAPDRDAMLFVHADHIDHGPVERLERLLVALGGQVLLDQINHDLGHEQLRSHQLWHPDRHEAQG